MDIYIRIPITGQCSRENEQGTVWEQDEAHQTGAEKALRGGSIWASRWVEGTSAVSWSGGRSFQSKGTKTLRKEQAKSSSNKRRAGETQQRKQTWLVPNGKKHGDKNLKYAKWGYFSHKEEARVLKFIQWLNWVSQVWWDDRRWRLLLSTRW